MEIQKNPTTKNQLRKWEKKLRTAKTEEAKKKAEQKACESAIKLIENCNN